MSDAAISLYASNFDGFDGCNHIRSGRRVGRGGWEVPGAVLMISNDLLRDSRVDCESYAPK